MLMIHDSSRLEQSIKDTQVKLEKKKGEIIQVQSAAQQAAAGPGPGPKAVKA
jgi:prefoldin beta subunit